MSFIFVKVADKDWCVSYSFLETGAAALFRRPPADAIVEALALKGLSSISLKWESEYQEAPEDLRDYWSIHIKFADEADEASFIMNVASGVYKDF